MRMWSNTKGLSSNPLINKGKFVMGGYCILLYKTQAFFKLYINLKRLIDVRDGLGSAFLCLNQERR